MRRILYITLAIAFIFSVCAVPVSAESYDFSSPTRWNSQVYENAYSMVFAYDADNDEYYPVSSVINPIYYAAYYDSSWTDWWTDFNDTPIWSIGNKNDVTSNFTLVSKWQTNTSNVLVSVLRGELANHFVIPGFRFSGVYLPEQGQYLKISFSVSAQQYKDLPQTDLFNVKNLFFLMPHQWNDIWTPGVVSATTVIKSRVDSIVTYDVYFDMDNFPFDSYSDELKSVPFDLVIRVPYYCRDAQAYNGQILFASDCTFPTGYEIVTVGGYQNAIESVENAVIAGFDELDKTLTEVDPGDTIIITELDQTFDKLDDTISDYDDAMQPVFQMKELYTHPPVANIIQSNTSNLDTTEVKDFLSLPWIISAFSMIFAFCIIRLILFGTKEG